jgi:hypothetical protein
LRRFGEAALVESSPGLFRRYAALVDRRAQMLRNDAKGRFDVSDGGAANGW